MQRFEFEVIGSVLSVSDLTNNGSLRIHCKPLKKPEISPVFCLWNDLETDINNGKLNPSFHGINTVVYTKQFNLKGDVELSSAHLVDPIIFNSSVNMSSIRARVTIMNSKLKHLGITHFGNITFNECELEHIRTGIPKNRRADLVYYQNRLVEI